MTVMLINGKQFEDFEEIPWGKLFLTPIDFFQEEGGGKATNGVNTLFKSKFKSFRKTGKNKKVREFHYHGAKCGQIFCFVRTFKRAIYFIMFIFLERL